MNAFRSIEFLDEGIVRMLDQRKLPHETIYNDYLSYEEVAQAIQDMVIRGAPAIGAAAAYGMALTAQRSQASDVDTLCLELATASEALARSRPTAVNLFWALDRMNKCIADPKLDTVKASKKRLSPKLTPLPKKMLKLTKPSG